MFRVLRIFYIFFLALPFFLNAQVTTSGLVFNLDANDSSSYSGSGNTWNDISGNNNHFNINNATYNNAGYFVFDGNDGMTGPPSNSFGLSQTDHTIEIVLMNTTTTNQSIINFRGNGHIYGINSHMPWGNSRIYYDVGGCCGGSQRIQGYRNILNQKVHVILRSKPSGSDRRQVFLNGSSILGSGGNSTSNSGFTSTPVNIGWISGEGHYFIGRLYSVRVYNRALTDQEIAANYNHYLNPNNAPTDIGLSSTSFNESISSGTTIGTLSTVDLDTSDSHTYSLVSGDGSNDMDNGSFTVSGTSLISSGTFDFETDSSLNINLQVSDGTATYTEAFSLTVSDVNESPDEIDLGSAISQGGLLIYVDASNPNSRGASQWSDLSGNGNHATVTGGALGNNSYYTLDGNDHFKWSSDVLSAGSNFTMQVMFKTTNTSWYGSMPLYNTFGPSDSGFWHHFQQNGTLGSTLGTMGTANSNDGVGIVQDEWQLTTFTYDGSALRLYKNGTLRFTKSGAVSWSLGNQGASAGKLNYRSSGAQYFFHGLMSSQLIYNRALTQAEILDNYNYLNGTITGASSGSSTLTIDEGSSVGSLIGTLSATGQDAGETLTYSLISNGQSSSQHNSSFTVSGTQIITAAAIDYETTPTLNLNVQVSDGTTAYQKAFTVYVNDINDNSPTNIGLSTPTFAEDISSGSVIATLSATDADSSANSFTYSLISGNGSNDSDNSSFTVSGTSLVSSGTFDYETDPSLNIYLQVSDGSNTYAKSVTVSVTDANDAPTDITLGNTQIFENIAIGTQVATITATDVDVGQSHTFALVSSGNSSDDDNGSFTVSGTYLLTNAVIDYETKSSYNIFLSASDGTASTTKALTITASDTLEPPTDVGFAGANIVTDGLVLHLDAGNTNSYSGSGNTWNDISGNGNDVTIQGNASFDNTNKFFNTGTNGFFNRGSGNNIPVGNSNYTMEVYINQPQWGNANGFISIGGFGQGNKANALRTMGGGNAFRHYWWGNDLDTSSNQVSTNNWLQVVAKFDGTSRSVWVNGVRAGLDNPGNAHNVNSSAIQISKTYSSEYQQGKIKVARIYNRAITDAEIATNYQSFTSSSGGTSTSTVSVDEEVAVGTVVGSLVATDADTSTHTFSLVGGSGDTNNGLFMISGTNLVVNGLIDYEQTTSLSVRVETSDGTATYSKALTININDINEPPVITSATVNTDNTVASVTFSEAVYDTNGGSGAIEAADFSLSISGGSATLTSATPASVSQSGNTIALSFSVTGTVNGNEVLTIAPVANSIYDTQGGTASSTQSSNTVNLIPPNATPSDINLSPNSVPENTSKGSIIGYLSTVDNDSQDTHTYSFASGSGDTDNVLFSIFDDRIISNTFFDYETKNIYSIRLQTSDGIASYSEAINIYISDVNEDIDDDGILNTVDNCPTIANPDQKDTDGDLIGDVCDTDDDNDGYEDSIDTFPLDSSEWTDTDSDGIGDNADSDDDNDSWSDDKELECNNDPLDSTDFPEDTDLDGIANCVDTDDDNDSYLDVDDLFPLDEKEWADNDGDKIGDNADLNDDNDECLDVDDDYPFDSLLCIDTDGDGIGDKYELDKDNDGVWDYRDAFPLDPNESVDSDGDGIGDNQDMDDNNDGFPDEEVLISSVLTPGQSGVESTWKIINLKPGTQVKVYAADGSLIYESIDYQNDWTGSNIRTGTPLPTGPYFYRIILGSTQELLEGWLYIFR